MLDTKLKKTRKLTKIAIALCVLIPAFLLVSLYPKIGKVMKEKREKFESSMEKLEDQYTEHNGTYGYILDRNFVNYAMEAGCYMYANVMAQKGVAIDMNVLEDYGWYQDYGTFYDQTYFQAIYNDGITEIKKNNTENVIDEENVGYLHLVFDSTGFLEKVLLTGGLQIEDSEFHEENLFAQANRSITQLKNNIEDYETNHNVDIDENNYMPKNFQMNIGIPGGSEFIREAYFEYYDYYDNQHQLYDTGGVVLICIAVFMVAISAFILPFVKKLNTGWEKLFSMPFEIVALIGTGTGFGIFGMFCAMAYTCGHALRHPPNLELVGFVLSDRMWFILLLVANFLAWSVLFFAEYVVLASIRQFLCKPLEYVKKRILIVKLLGWMKKRMIQFYRWILSIDIWCKLHQTVLKIVGINYVCVAVMCCVFYSVYRGFMDADIIPCVLLIAGIYSVIVYVICMQTGLKIKEQYGSVLHASEQMAEGDLKISMSENLGPFKQIGKSLEKVQQGFEKAVVEEAKSQNMKTELITNVSHDLKTPLTAIITYVDLLKKEDLSESERSSYIHTLEQKSQRLKVLIEDLFEVSKAQSGNVQMNFMEVDIVNLIKQVRMEMEDQIHASTLTFRFNLPEKKVLLQLDGQRTYRVFENLLNNALKYAMPNTRVYIDVQQSDEDVKVLFRNISARELDVEAEHLTERFVRGDASRKSEGSGLGLAIAKSFVELQNGKLNIETDGDLFKVIIVWKR